MDKEIKLAAVGDNCMDVYDRTGEAYPGGNPVNVAVYTPVSYTHLTLPTN